MYDLILNYTQIEADKSADAAFHVSLQFDEAFDFNFPFRPLLAFIADCLRRQGVSVEESLPDYFEFEDFVEGHLDMDAEQIGVYFEHSLSYVSFSSNSRAELLRLITASEGKPFQHEGYGLDDAQ